jgi:uncharacterized DUF497 family protein
MCGNSVWQPIEAPEEFDWDDRKARSNLAKHGVPLEYATRVFLDAARIDFDVSRTAEREARRKVVGMIDRRLFCIVYTVRGEATRLISARRASAKEKDAYGPFHP